MKTKKSHLPVVMVTMLVMIALLAAPLNNTALAASVLGIGTRGEVVRKVQTRLIQWGYMKGAADGIYGQLTTEAVKKFQAKYGLTVDGRVGQATAKLIGISLSGSSGGSLSAVSYTKSDLNLLARLVHAEAKGESYKGKVAVAAVVLNRVESSLFPNTIYGVIYQKGQFSPVSNGSIKNEPSADAINAARDALNGTDPTGGALYFYNPRATSDRWIRTRTVKTVIGNHTFAV